MKLPRTDRNLAELRETIPEGVIGYLAEIPEKDRADLYSTIVVLENTVDLHARVVVTDGVETVDFGVPFYDEAGELRTLSASWELPASRRPAGRSCMRWSATKAAMRRSQLRGCVGARQPTGRDQDDP